MDRSFIIIPDDEEEDENYEEEEEEVVGLSQEQINQIPETTSIPKNETCSICLTEIQGENESARKLPCNNFFHSHCIVQWLLISSKCPFCRHQLGNNGGDNLDEDDVAYTDPIENMHDFLDSYANNADDDENLSLEFNVTERNVDEYLLEFFDTPPAYNTRSAVRRRIEQFNNLSHSNLF